MSGNSEAAASGASPTGGEEAASEIQVGLYRDKDKAEGQTVSFTAEEDHATGEEEKEETVEVCENSSGVNLFSIRLASSTRDSVSSSDEECQQATASELTVSNTDTEPSDHQTHGGSVSPTHEPFTEAECEGRDEQEEGSSGYQVRMSGYMDRLL